MYATDTLVNERELVLRLIDLSLIHIYFRSRNIQVFIAAVIFVGMPLYAAVVMKGGAVFIEQIFQIDFNISLDVYKRQHFLLPCNMPISFLSV